MALIFSLMSLSSMSHVDFKKWPCCRIEFSHSRRCGQKTVNKAMWAKSGTLSMWLLIAVNNPSKLGWSLAMTGDAWWLLFEWSDTEWQCATPGDISLSMAALHSFLNCGELALSGHWVTMRHSWWVSLSMATHHSFSNCSDHTLSDNVPLLVRSHSAWRLITHFPTSEISQHHQDISIGGILPVLCRGE